MEWQQHDKHRCLHAFWLRHIHWRYLENIRKHFAQPLFQWHAKKTVHNWTTSCKSHFVTARHQPLSGIARKHCKLTLLPSQSQKTGVILHFQPHCSNHSAQNAVFFSVMFNLCMERVFELLFLCPCFTGWTMSTMWGHLYRLSQGVSQNLRAIFGLFELSLILFFYHNASTTMHGVLGHAVAIPHIGKWSNLAGLADLAGVPPGIFWCMIARTFTFSRFLPIFPHLWIFFWVCLATLPFLWVSSRGARQVLGGLAIWKGQAYRCGCRENGRKSMDPFVSDKYATRHVYLY